MTGVDNVSHPLRVIVTGGIGSGKSTVLRVLQDLGAVIIEADRIGREILEPGGAAFAAVAARWPEVVADGVIDRAKLAAITFSDPDQLEELESISHPLIAAAIAARLAKADDRDVVLELPLLSDIAGPGWYRIVVDAPRVTRLQRALDRGLEPDDVIRRMEAQPSRREWLAAADAVIENQGTIAELAQRVSELWLRLRAARRRHEA